MIPPETLTNRAILRAQFQTLSAAEREAFMERAAIKEFDGRQPREQADREALNDVIHQRKHEAR